MIIDGCARVNSGGRRMIIDRIVGNFLEIGMIITRVVFENQEARK